MLVVFFAYVQEKTEKKSSKIEIAATGCSQNRIRFFARNVGNRPGVIADSPNYRITDSRGAEYKGRLQKDKEIKTDSFFLQAGAGSLFEFYPVTEDGLQTQFQGYDKNDSKCSLEVEIEVVEFSETTSKRRVTCSCD
ncbi:hypothetical protein [Roseibium sp.]|uniref:hypothetical protein n=1 Tax=Roseibium sp. TaxID=1936156 RepID=UPI003BA9C567